MISSKLYEDFNRYKKKFITITDLCDASHEIIRGYRYIAIDFDNLLLADCRRFSVIRLVKVYNAGVKT